MTADVELVALGVALAEADRGVFEDTPNDSPRIRQYHENAEPPIPNPVPWCALFVQKVTDVACAPLGVTNPLDAVKREAYVLDYVTWAAAEGRLAGAKPGRLVCYYFPSGPARWNHIGIILSPPDQAGDFVTIEGNTGPAGGRDGDGVYIRRRNIHDQPTCFIRWSDDPKGDA